MAGTTVRIRPETRDTLPELAQELKEPMQEVLAKAVEAYWGRHILEAHNAAYAALRADPKAWAEEMEERVALGIEQSG